MKYRLRDKKTGLWICYGDTAEILETDDAKTADELAQECWDYNYEPEVVEFTP